MKWLKNILRRGVQLPPDLPPWPDVERKSPYSVPRILESMRHAQPADRVRLASIVAECMQNVPPEAWTQLYPCLRWVSLRVADVRWMADLDSAGAVHVLGAASLNGSGWVRDAALAELENRPDAEAVPYALLRLNDWVPQVREHAEHLVQILLRRVEPDAFITHWWLIDHLLTFERTDSASARQRILDRLHEDDARDALERGLSHSRRAARLFCARCLADRLPHEPALVDLLARNEAPAVRKWLGMQLAVDPGSYGRQHLVHLLQDHAALVRVAIVRSLSADEVQRIADVLDEMLFDDHAVVREAVRSALWRRARLVTRGFGPRYRDRLATAGERVNPGTVAGLGETGGADDYDIVREYLVHERGPMRAAALYACIRLNRERSLEEAIAGLADESGRVRRVAVAALSRHAADEADASIRSVFYHGSETASEAAFAVLRRRPMWQPVPEILHAIAAGDGRLNRMGWSALAEWYRQYAVAGWLHPDEATRQRLRPALERIHAARPCPPPELRATWEAAMKWIKDEVRERAR